MFLAGVVLLAQVLDLREGRQQRDRLRLAAAGRRGLDGDGQLDVAAQGIAEQARFGLLALRRRRGIHSASRA